MALPKVFVSGFCPLAVANFSDDFDMEENVDSEPGRGELKVEKLERLGPLDPLKVENDAIVGPDVPEENLGPGSFVAAETVVSGAVTGGVFPITMETLPTGFVPWLPSIRGFEIDRAVFPLDVPIAEVKELELKGLLAVLELNGLEAAVNRELAELLFASADSGPLAVPPPASLLESNADVGLPSSFFSRSELKLLLESFGLSAILGLSVAGSVEPAFLDSSNMVPATPPLVFNSDKISDSKLPELPLLLLSLSSLFGRNFSTSFGFAGGSSMGSVFPNSGALTWSGESGAAAALFCASSFDSGLGVGVFK